MRYFSSYSGFWVRWVAVFALLFQALMPLAQTVQVEDEFGDFRTLVICTAYGLQQITVGSDTEPDDESSTSESCPVCMAQSIGGKILATAGMAIPMGPAYLRIRMPAPRRIASFSTSLPTRQDARAPPLSA